MPSAPDRALRRLVAQLSALPPEDVAAILDELDGAQRPKAEQLLRDYLAPPGSSAAAAPAALSPWLAERVARPTAKMTPHAHSVLQAAARRLFAAAEPAPAARSLIDRVVGAVAPR